MRKEKKKINPENLKIGRQKRKLIIKKQERQPFAEATS